MILLDQIPNYVEEVLEGRLGQHGFGLEETEAMPQWNEVTLFARGEVQRFLHERWHRTNPFTFSRDSGENLFTFEDVQSITRNIISGFGHWWEQECQGIKVNLMALDTEESGRVKLSKFYKRGMEGEWRFGESEA